LAQDAEKEATINLKKVTVGEILEAHKKEQQARENQAKVRRKLALDRGITLEVGDDLS
jgi:predicted nucleic acid-binding protein